MRVFPVVRSLGACDALALTPAHPRRHQSTNISTPDETTSGVFQGLVARVGRVDKRDGCAIGPRSAYSLGVTRFST